MKTRMMILIGTGGLLVVALFAAGMFAGNSLAQDGGAQPAGSDSGAGDVQEKQVIIKEIEVEGGPGVDFPFETALRDLAAAGELTTEQVDAIMSDLSERTDAVNYESTTSADGAEHEVAIDITIRSDDVQNLRAAMEATLEQAVSEGLLTAEQAQNVLAEVDAAPDPLEMGREGAIVVKALDSRDFTDSLRPLLENAVAEGTVSEAEAATFLDVLDRLLGE